jgi:peptidoglycan/LPS O-acetylase OafA/YrhL
MSSDISTRAAAIGLAPRLDAVDGLRAVACLMVLFFHCYNVAGQPELRVSLGPVTPNVLRLVMFCNNGVTLFIVLSGFCLFLPVVSRLGERRFAFGGFMKRRCLRIVPAYFATMGLALMWFQLSRGLGEFTGLKFNMLGGWPDLASLGAHVLLLHTLHPKWAFDILGPFWSLGLEWQYYLVFPLVVGLFSRLGVWRATALCIGLTLVYRIAASIWLPTEVSVRWTYCSAVIPGRLGDFSLGMAVAMLYAKGAFRKPAPIGWIALGAIASLIAMVGGMKTSPFSPLNDLLWAIAFTFWIIAALGAAPVMKTLLSIKPLVWIGERSYSVYLLHMLVIVSVAPFVATRVVDPLTASAVLSAIVLPVSLVVAAMWYRWFEAPFMARRRREASTPSTANFEPATR